MRSSTFDRAEVAARLYTGAAAVVSGPIAYGVAYLSGMRGAALFAGAALGALLSGTTVYFISTRTARGAGAAVLALLQPSGNSTPYEEQFSQALAFEAADDHSAAEAWYESSLAQSPNDTRLRVAFADFCARQQRPHRAEALYQQARRLSRHDDTELYCTQRIIDLRLGALDQPEQACTELRRLMERFPASRESEGAAAALARLKRELRERTSETDEPSE